MVTCIEHNKIGIRAGYAQVSWEGTRQYMHRLAYCFSRGISMAVLGDSVVRHTCDNARCINPQHLILGTQQDNVQDRKDRGRCARLRGVLNGNTILTTEDVLYIRKHYIPRCKINGAKHLAKKFNVDRTTIGKVANNTLWAHLPTMQELRNDKTL